MCLICLLGLSNNEKYAKVLYMETTTRGQNMKTESKNIKAGDVIIYRGDRGFLEMVVESVHVNSTTYDKNNCGVWLQGQIDSNNYGRYVAWYGDNGVDGAKLPLSSSVEVVFNILED